TITGTAGVAAKFVATALPATTAGVAQTFTVTAYDAFGNVAVGYNGLVVFSSSDYQAGLPGFYTFTAADSGSHTFGVTVKTADAGTHTFSMTFKSSGGQTFTVTDAANATVVSSQRDIPVTAAAVSGFVIRAASNVTAGVAFNVTVQAVDAFGNVVTGYAGKV